MTAGSWSRLQVWKKGSLILPAHMLASPGAGTYQTEGSAFHFIACNSSSLDLITFLSHLEFWPPQPPVADSSVV